MEEELFGYIETIVFATDESGFTVARLKEPKKSDLITLVGVMPHLQRGETVRCKGLFKHHPKFGRQFEVKELEARPPSDLVGIHKYLASGMIKGIGKGAAEWIVKKFGTGTLKIIDENPERLIEVKGIGEKRAAQIKKCWEEQRSIREVMIFLRGHGVSPAFAHKIYKAYGDESIERVKDNPYALAKEIYGIGFKSADQIATNLGIPPSSPIRIDSGIEHVLWELSTEGHVCYPLSPFLDEASSILNVPKEGIEARILALAQAQVIVQKEQTLWVKPLFLSEQGIARELFRLSTAPCALRPVKAQQALNWVQEKLRLALAPEQQKAVSSGMQNKCLIVTGGPGTGKSTITRAILAIAEKLTSRILLAAPTGRAAKRLSQITSRRSSTIHSLLEMDFSKGGFKKNRSNPLLCDLIIVDEASMIDTQLLYHLLKAIPSAARLILIGDSDQLPSVGPGNVLKDLLSSNLLPATCLKEIFRQAKGSRIVTNAHRINQGIFPDLAPRAKSDFLFIEKENQEEIVKEIIELTTLRLPRSYGFHRFDEIQVLSPMKRGVVGIENLNLELQNALNPSPTALSRMGRSFRVSDKVMQIRNNYKKKVFNGDVGRVTAIDLTEQELKVSFDGMSVTYDFSDLDEIVLAYAASIHKFQGSECPCIILPLHLSHFKLLSRNLLYTGITRGKKLVVLIGSKRAVAIATRNADVKERHTGLKERLLELWEEIRAKEAARCAARQSRIDSCKESPS